MSKVADADLGDRLRAAALQTLYWPRKAPLVLDSRAALYEHAATAIGPDGPVLYLEFGVAQGRSMREMAQRLIHPETLLFGFDSFEGLPEPWLHLPQGAFANHGRAPVLRDPRVHFVKGWFQNTLHDFLRDFAPMRERRVLVNFDADLYASTLFLLTSLWPHFPDYHFTMDDFMCDDAVALADFAAAYPVEIGFLAQSRGGGPGPNPNQVFGRMRRTKLVVEKPGGQAG